MRPLLVHVCEKNLRVRSKQCQASGRACSSSTKVIVSPCYDTPLLRRVRCSSLRCCPDTPPIYIPAARTAPCVLRCTLIVRVFEHVFPAKSRRQLLLTAVYRRYNDQCNDRVTVPSVDATRAGSAPRLCCPATARR